jgi:hypothetical protein
MPGQLDELLPWQIEALCRRIDHLADEAKKAEREAKRG